MKTIMMDLKVNSSACYKGLLGMVSSGAGSYISFLPQVEAWLRITSLLVGIGVGLVTIWSIWKHRNDKKRK